MVREEAHGSHLFQMEGVKQPSLGTSWQTRIQQKIVIKETGRHALTV